jgi:hypothetical protein
LLGFTCLSTEFFVKQVLGAGSKKDALTLLSEEMTPSSLDLERQL